MAEISFGTTGGIRPQAARAGGGDGTIMRMLVIGSFSGRQRTAAERATLRPVVVDRDNLDEVIAGHNIRIDGLVTGEGVPPTTVEIRTLEDFHPDTLFDRLPIFASLRQTRRKLTNPNTFAAAAEEVRAWGRETKSEAKPQGKPQESPQPEAPRSEYSTEGLFDLTLGETHTQQRETKRDDAADWHAMIREIAAPYALPGTAAQESQLTGVVDGVVSETMRQILANERFRDIEMAWRGVDLLTRRIDTDEMLKLYVLDLSADEVAQDLGANEDLTRSMLYKRLVEETVNTPGGKPWGAVLVLNHFDATAEDAGTLGRLAQIGAAAGAPVIAGVDERAAGCPSLAMTRDPRDWKWKADEATAAAWKALRGLPAAEYLGLALPRVMLRLPYGSRTTPTEKFTFEELPENDEGAARHERLAWGPAAIVCGCLIGEGFAADGWRLDLNEHLEFEGLPLFVDEFDGEKAAVPCAEALIIDAGAEALVAAGFMPLISYRDSDRVRLGGFRSVRGGAARLAGRWSGS